MKLAIMQPYFLPYIGYFQLMAAADLFVVYDNIKYTKKGWINRNRLLLNGTDTLFSIPLSKDSDALDIRERRIAADFRRDKLLNQIAAAYRRAPCFAEVFPLAERIVNAEESNLFVFLNQALVHTCAHLGIDTEIRASSTIPIDHTLKGQDKVLALCAATGATHYINPPGGVELYSREAFRDKGLELSFLRPLPLEYGQFGAPFVPWLSILDVMMFNSVERIRQDFLSHYELF